MPTQLPSGEKSAFIAIVNAVDAFEAQRLVSVLNNYEDIPTAIARQLNVFAANPKYLQEAMAVFTNSALVTAKIYNGQSSAIGTVSDPKLVVGSQLTSGMNITANNIGFAVLGNSNVSNITVSANKSLNNLYIGPGSTVDILDSTATGAFVTGIQIKNFKNSIGSLNAIKQGSTIGNVIVDDGAYYGGYSSVDTQATCAIPVTALAANAITTNSIELDWTNPANGFIFATVYFRRKGNATWLKATEVNGDFLGDNGFIFRDLEDNTYYDFKVVVTCNNGGESTPTTLSSKTVCCGSGGGDTTQVYKACKITILIKDTPDPTNTQTLCNGHVIAKEYPSGTTIAVPYLIGRKAEILEPFILDNSNMQQFTETNFDDSTGTWTASTNLVKFLDGSVATVNVNLPI